MGKRIVKNCLVCDMECPKCRSKNCYRDKNDQGHCEDCGFITSIYFFEPTTYQFIYLPNKF